MQGTKSYNNTCKEHSLQVTSGKLEKGESMEDMNEKERKDARAAMIYEIRLLIDADEKETYTKAEILKLLDTVARAKEND
jgi:hypothetical protein